MATVAPPDGEHIDEGVDGCGSVAERELGRYLMSAGGWENPTRLALAPCGGAGGLTAHCVCVVWLGQGSMAGCAHRCSSATSAWSRAVCASGTLKTTRSPVRRCLARSTRAEPPRQPGRARRRAALSFILLSVGTIGIKWVKANQIIKASTFSVQAAAAEYHNSNHQRRRSSATRNGGDAQPEAYCDGRHREAWRR